MGIFNKIFGKKKSSKLEPPLLDEKFHGMMGLEFGMYLTWVEDTTGKSIMGKELERRIKNVIKANAITTENEAFVWSSFSVCLLYTSPSPRDRQKSRMPSSA